MVDIYAQNRSTLARIITQLNRFTYEDLCKAYKNETQEQEIRSLGMNWSIQDYLDYSCEVDALIFKDSHYLVVGLDTPWNVT